MKPLKQQGKISLNCFLKVELKALMRIAELEKVASETGIDFDNLVAVNSVLETLPDDQVNQLMDDLGQMIEEGFADEINETITALSEIEGGLENALNFNSLEECQAAGASNCEATAAIMDANNPN